jgi:hypothetical protein
MMKERPLRRNGMRWLTRLFTRRPRTESPSALWIYVACSRCGEAIRVRADRRYDLVSEMRDPGEAGPAYTLHKDIVGSHCFQRIAVDVAFDQRLEVIERRISGGRWLTEEEYRATTNAPS